MGGRKTGPGTRCSWELPDGHRCEGEVHSRGYCGNHYAQAKARGLFMPRPRHDPRARFWARVNKDGPTSSTRPDLGSCWEWDKVDPDDGRCSVFTIGGRKHRAHIHAFEFDNGPVPEGMVVDHRCHNRACVRPSHLRAITHAQNCQNRAGAMSKSRTGVRGVCWEPRSKRYVATGTLEGKTVFAGRGYFKSLYEADVAVTQWRLENYTHSEHDALRLKELLENPPKDGL